MFCFPAEHTTASTNTKKVVAQFNFQILLLLQKLLPGAKKKRAEEILADFSKETARLERQNCIFFEQRLDLICKFFACSLNDFPSAE